MTTLVSENNQDNIKERTKERKVELEKINTVFKALTTDENGNRLSCQCIWNNRTHRIRECMYCKEDIYISCSNIECDLYSHPSLKKCGYCGVWELYK